MEFVSPYFLFGLCAISIPIIIHLFNFRRYKKVYFTNVKFIEDLQQKTKKKSQLKHLLVLLMRILAVSSLVLAFAQPYIPVSENLINLESKNAVSVYIDNSFSLEAHSSKGLLIEEAKNKALEIASAYNTTDLFQLLTNDFEGKHQHFVNKDEFVELINEVKISPAVRNLSEVNRRQFDLIKNNDAKNKTTYFISDFQKSISDIDNLLNDSNIKTFLIPLKANKTDNLFIDSCWFDSPIQQNNRNVKLSVRIKNLSSENFEKIPIKLLINDNQKALASFDIEANSETEVVLPYTIRSTGIQFCKLEITDYPVIYDDHFYFSYFVSSSIPILSINGKDENVYLNSLFKNDSAFSFNNSSEKHLDYSSFSNYRLIILNELKSISSGLELELLRFMKNGGSIIVFPASEIDIENYKLFLSKINAGYYTALDTFRTKLENINLNHPVYRDVFEKIPENISLPYVFSHYSIKTISQSNVEILLKIQNSDIFLLTSSYQKGRIYLSAVPLNAEFSNFPKHAIFVPTMYKIALLSDYVNKLFYTVGSNNQIELNNIQFAKNDEILKLRNKSTGFEFIPEIRNVDSQTQIYFHNQLKEADNYSLFYGEKEIAGLSFNYDRKESDLSCYNADDLNALILKSNLKNYSVFEINEKPLIKMLQEMNQGIRLWKLFVLFALLFLAFEIILLRIW